MRWPWTQSVAHPSQEAELAVSQADRVLRDAVNLDGRAEQVRARSEEIKRVNHIADAVVRSINPRGV